MIGPVGRAGVAAGARVTVGDPVGDADGRADAGLGRADGSAPDARGLGPTFAATTPGEPASPAGSAGAAINGAPTHAPTTTTATTRAMSGRRSPRFMSDGGAT